MAGEVRSWHDVPGAKAPALIPAGDRRDRGDEGRSAHPGGPAEARHHRPHEPARRALAVRLEATGRAGRRAPPGVDADVAPPVARRQRLRASDPRAARDRRHRHRRGDRRRGPRRARRPAGAGAFPPVAAGRSAAACSALEITQPDGPGFTVDGWQVRWQKWSLRVGFCPREGLVIHDVRYDDDGAERRIAHRLSIAELVIPYGDPEPRQLPQERVRHGRGRDGVLHQLAGAGL